jgi:hypothetical protein
MPDKKASVRPFFAGGREQIKLPVKSNRGGWGGTGSVSKPEKGVGNLATKRRIQAGSFTFWRWLGLC